MALDIVIISAFCGNFSEIDNDRFLYLAKKLCVRNSVELITSDFYHTKKVTRTKRDFDFPFKVTFIHEPGYPTNVCPQRIVSHEVLAKNVSDYLERRKRPDVIYCAIPPLGVAKAAATYAQKKGVRFEIDIQDLWPEAFQMVFNPPVLGKALYGPMFALADSVYAAADEICAVSQTYVDRALRVNKKCSAGHAVFLGTELRTFDANASAQVDLQKKPGELWLAYCGTLGASYDLTVVFDAMRVMLNRGQLPPMFIVMGDGPKKDDFERYAERFGLPVVFTGRLPYNQMCALLCQCDMTVNPIEHNAAQSIINKHADYAASGLPVLNTQEGEEYRTLVDEYHMGFNVKNGDAPALADCIARLMRDEQLRQTMGANARRCAEERFDRSVAYDELMSVIEGNSGKGE